MESLSKSLKEKRPNLSEGSIKTYAYILKSLYSKLTGRNDLQDVEKVFDDTEKVLEFLKTVEPNKRKTTLSSLYVLTGKQVYRENMLQDINSYKQDIGKQEKTESQKENWVDKEDIEKKYKLYKTQANKLFKNKNLNANETQILQNYIILILTSGLFFPPRRSLDWCELKVRDINDKTDNYILTTGKKQYFKFNIYKTAKTYGEQTVEIPKEVSLILKKWIHIISPECDYLLFDSKNNKLNSVKLNQRLNGIFDNKKVSTSMLRHSYLTSKFGYMIEENKQLDKTMTEMGSSKTQSQIYIKS